LSSYAAPTRTVVCEPFGLDLISTQQHIVGLSFCRLPSSNLLDLFL